MTHVAPQSPLPGTRPAGAQSEADASRNIREMFSRIAPRYDFLNHALSLSFDRLWRARTARRFAHILQRPNAVALDICCGTGDLTFAFEHIARRASAHAGAHIFGSDFALPMLSLAREKARRNRTRSAVFAADSLALPVADSSVDLIASAFGFRNLANYRAGLAEMFRALRSGGEVGILEFCVPQSGPLAALYRVYFTKILPRLGGAISDSAAYSYLPASVSKFPPPEQLATMMREAGFASVTYETWTFGAVALHRARKP